MNATNYQVTDIDGNDCGVFVANSPEAACDLAAVACGYASHEAIIDEGIDGFYFTAEAV